MASNVPPNVEDRLSAIEAMLRDLVERPAPPTQTGSPPTDSPAPAGPATGAETTTATSTTEANPPLDTEEVDDVGTPNLSTKDSTIYSYYDWNPRHLSLDADYKAVKEVAKATPAPKGLKWPDNHVLSVPEEHKTMLAALREIMEPVRHFARYASRLHDQPERVAQAAEVCFLRIARLVHQRQWNAFMSKQLDPGAAKLLERARLMPGYDERDLEAIERVANIRRAQVALQNAKSTATKKTSSAKPQYGHGGGNRSGKSFKRRPEGNDLVSFSGKPAKGTHSSGAESN